MAFPIRRRNRVLSFSNPLVLFFAGVIFALVGFLSFVPSIWKNSLSSHSPSIHNGKRLFSSPETIPIDLIQSFDAILVLGGGRPSSIDHPPIYVERRCDDAVEVFRRRMETTIDRNGSQHKKLPILCLSAGTAHMPQLLSEDGLPIWESTACAAYIKDKSEAIGLPLGSDSIYVETSSFDTIGNAYFARTTHTDPIGWRTILVVTNEFHMMRTMKIFNWIFSIGSGTAREYEIFYLESPNIGMDPDVVMARKDREASSTKSVDRLSSKYSNSLADIHHFLTQEHALYASGPLVARGKDASKESAVNDAVKKSYGLS